MCANLKTLFIKKSPTKKKSNKKNIYIEEKEKELARCLGVSNKISYNDKHQNGKLELHFESLEQLEELLNKLTKNPQ
jgi:hypothetical protein